MMVPSYKWTHSRPDRMMAEAHERKLAVCTSLEELADSLPDRLDSLACLKLAGELVPLLRHVHDFEEETVFPLFQELSSRDDASERTICRLKAEHIEDQAYADEICEILMLIGRGEPVSNPEAVGFMLRGFFTALRRHVAFEQTHVLSIIIRHEDRQAEPT